MTLAPQTLAHARAMRRDPTPAERLVWNALRAALPEIKVRRQVPCGPYIADFTIPAANLAIELDGASHDKPADVARDAWFAEWGFRILRFGNRDVLGNLEGVVAAIGEAVRAPHPTLSQGRGLSGPSPLGEGRGEGPHQRRSLTNRLWRLTEPLDRTTFAIAQSHNLPEPLARLLAGRGFVPETVASHLEPTLRASLPDPSSLVGMMRAATRLADAVVARETVAVFGDYDVDGACASALLLRLLAELGCPTLFHIPDRLTEGFGPNAPALRALASRGATLIVCVDCGTAAADVFAAVPGPDVIVLDHHKAEGPAPPVLATVNPNRLDCASGQGDLCATAIVFMTAVALLRELRTRGRENLPDLIASLDLVALATVCDVMPLTGVNRALVRQGFRVMARRDRPGIDALLTVAGARTIDAFTCGFGLGPRINASGRIAEPDMGLRLLLTDDPAEATLLAARLDAINRQRQEVEAAMLDAAHAQAHAGALAGHAVLIAAAVQWHPGVAGIVAGRLRERHNRPALVAGIADGIAKGSGRSVPGLDLGAAMIAARQSGLLTTGGGHAMACGFSLPAARLPELQAFLNESFTSAADRPGAEDLVIEASVEAPAVTVDFAECFARLAPFGNGNPEPVIMLRAVRVTAAQRIGKDGATLRLTLAGPSGNTVRAMLFRASGPLADALLNVDGPALHVAGHLRADTWQESVRATLFVIDAAIA